MKRQLLIPAAVAALGLGAMAAAADCREELNQLTGGKATAAEQAMGEAGSAERSDRAAAIARAEAALAAGDEAACMAAVEDARSM